VNNGENKLDANRILVSIIRPSPEEGAQLMVAYGGKIQRFALSEAQLLLLNYQTASVLWKKMETVPESEVK
jgi:hypothetical protein